MISSIRSGYVEKVVEKTKIENRERRRFRMTSAQPYYCSICDPLTPLQKAQHINYRLRSFDGKTAGSVGFRS
jgi:hypothetical protein